MLSPADEDAATVAFIDFDFTTMPETSVIQMLAQRPADAPFAYVVTPNVDHAVRLQRSRSDLWPVYRAAGLTLCDSRILALLARQAGLVLPVIPGSDLTRLLFEKVIHPADPVTIIGANPEQVQMLVQRYGLNRVYHYNPPMGFIRDPVEIATAVQFVVGAKARYNFFAVGSPQQEILAYRVQQAGGGRGIGFCIGASLDFLTGTQKRAPMLMRLVAMEWFYRLVSDPARMWRRYLCDGPGILQVMRDWKRGFRL